MNILITAPSLNPYKNVNGISAVVNSIIDNSKEQFFHYQLGKDDVESSKIKRIFKSIAPLVIVPFFLKKNKIELVHDNLPFNTKGILREAVIVFWSLIFGIPILVHVHGGTFLMKKCKNPLLLIIIKFMFSSAKKVVVLSEIEKQKLLELYAVNAFVLHNAVDTKFYTPIINKNWSKKKTVLFIGRLHESKGLEDIVEAFKTTYIKTPFLFVLCGEGELKDYLIQCLDPIMGKDFQFLGIVSGEKKRDIIQKSDIFLLPSRYGEGLPISLLETMSCGLIPLTTDDASMKYILKDGQNGLRVSKYNPEDLSKKMTIILEMSNDNLQLLSENARETIVNDFDLERFILKLESLYESIKK